MNAAPPAPNTSRLPGLDALRGIAALVVVFGHAIAIIAGPPASGMFGIAVDVFFCLSGYVMARTYEHRMPGPISFLRLRWRRLWATMAVGSLINVIAFPPQSPHEALIALAVILLIPTFSDPERVYPINGVAWSIAGELFANVLHGALLHRVKAAHLALFGIACVIGVHVVYGSYAIGHNPATFTGGLVRAAGSYAIGIALFRWRGDRPVLPAWPMFLLPLTFVLPSDWPFAVVVTLITPALCVTSALAFAGTPALNRLGALSFPLYAVHATLQVALYLHFGAGLIALILTPIAAAATLLAIQNALAQWRRSARGKPATVSAV